MELTDFVCIKLITTFINNNFSKNAKNKIPENPIIKQIDVVKPF